MAPRPGALGLSLPASATPIEIEVPWPVRAATLDGVPVGPEENGAVVAPSGAAGRTLRIERG